MKFSNGQIAVGAVPVRALEINKPFRTYVSLIKPATFYKVFADELIPSRAWDRIEVRTSSEALGISPRRIEVQHVQCVNPGTFVAENP